MLRYILLLTLGMAVAIQCSPLQPEAELLLSPSGSQGALPSVSFDNMTSQARIRALQLLSEARALASLSDTGTSPEAAAAARLEELHTLLPQLRGQKLDSSQLAGLLAAAEAELAALPAPRTPSRLAGRYWFGLQSCWLPFRHAGMRATASRVRCQQSGFVAKNQPHVVLGCVGLCRTGGLFCACVPCHACDAMQCLTHILCFHPPCSHADSHQHRLVGASSLLQRPALPCAAPCCVASQHCPSHACCPQSDPPVAPPSALAHHAGMSPAGLWAASSLLWPWSPSLESTWPASWC